MKRWAPFILALGCIATVVVLLRQTHRRIVFVRGKTASVLHDTMITREALRSRTFQIASENAQVIRLKAELHRLHDAAAEPSTPASPQKPPLDWATWFKTYEEKQRDPKTQLQYLDDVRVKLRIQYAPLYRQLGLTADKIDAFERNEVQYAAMSSDLFAAVTEQGMNLRDPAVGKLYQKMEEQREAAEQAVLGPNNYQQFSRYEYTAGARALVANLIAETTVAGAPLTADQKEQLIQAIADAAPRSAPSNRTANLLAVDWSRVDTAAALILSAEQRDIFTNFEPSTGSGRHWCILNQAFNQAVAAESPSPKNSTPAAAP